MPDIAEADIESEILLAELLADELQQSEAAKSTDPPGTWWSWTEDRDA